MLNVAELRAEFPALSERAGDHTLAFLDAPGGTQVPRRVIGAIAAYLETSNANVHGPFLTSRRTDDTVEAAHAAMGDLLGCSPEEIVFGANMTSLTFSLARALAREWGDGDEVLTTWAEHDANVAPWRALEEGGVAVQQVDIDAASCLVDLDDLARKLSPRTRLVAIGYASNAVGTIQPVAEIVRMAHSYGALVFVDAVHYAPHRLIDVAALDCDFLACSAYKFFGPHIGVLYGKRRHLASYRPYKVRPAAEVLPYRWETGTQNHECLAGVTAAVDYLAAVGQEMRAPTHSRREALGTAFALIERHESSLAERMLGGLLRIRGLRIYGITDLSRLHQRTPTFGIRLENVTPSEAAAHLAGRGICAWSGNFYALSVTERLGIEERGGLLRLGLVHYNTAEEVERVLRELASIT